MEIEDQASSTSYDLTPAPSPVSKLHRRQTGRLRKRDNLGEGGKEPKSNDGEKAWFSVYIKYSLWGGPTARVDRETLTSPLLLREVANTSSLLLL